MTAKITEAGGCLCGGLRFQAKAQPVRLTLCFCRFCQRATGSTHMVEPIFRKADFEVIAGEAAIYSLQSQGSGKQVNAHFCAQCGTKIFLSFERFPDVVGVYAGTFDNPSWFDCSSETTACLFLESAAVGAIIPAGVPVYQQHRSALDGSPNEAIIFAVPHQVNRVT